MNKLYDHPHYPNLGVTIRIQPSNIQELIEYKNFLKGELKKTRRKWCQVCRKYDNCKKTDRPHYGRRMERFAFMFELIKEEYVRVLQSFDPNNRKIYIGR